MNATFILCWNILKWWQDWWEKNSLCENNLMEIKTLGDWCEKCFIDFLSSSWNTSLEMHVNDILPTGLNVVNFQKQVVVDVDFFTSEPWVWCLLWSLIINDIRPMHENLFRRYFWTIFSRHNDMDSSDKFVNTGGNLKLQIYYWFLNKK